MELENFVQITLPSMGIPYGISPDVITARAYNGRDEVYLAEVNHTNLDAKYLPVLTNIIRGINPAELTLGDRLYVVVWEYIKSYGGIVNLKTICPNCLNEIEIQIDLRELDVVQLPVDFKYPHDVTLPSGKSIKLKFLTVQDEINASKFAETSNEGLIYRLAASIVDDANIIERLEHVKSMGIMDVTAIRAFHEKYYHGPNMDTKFVCPKCSSEEDIEVPFRIDYIFPRGEFLRRNFGAGI